MTIEFHRGEELAASKLNDLSQVAHGNRVSGNVTKSRTGGSVVGRQDTRNYMEEFRPFTVERLTATKIIVRGGTWTQYNGITRHSTSLTVDGSGDGASPENYKTIDDGISASTAYSVYLELDTSGDTLAANIVATASFPADAADIFRLVLVEFESTASGTLPDIDTRQGDIITTIVTENDHSWHYNPYTKTVTVGSIWLGDNTTTAETLDSWPTDGDLSGDDTTDITYYIKVDWATSTNTNIAPTCTWVDSKSQADGVWFIPVLEFDADGNCTERLCSDLYLPDVHIPTPSSASYDGYLKFNHTDQDVEWVFGESDDAYKGPFFDGNGEVLDTEYVKAH